MKKNFMILFFIGAIVGSFLDATHVYAGIAWYAHPTFWRMAWWVPFLMGSATVLIAYSHFKIHPQSRNLNQALAAGFFFFLLSYIVTGGLSLGNGEKALLVLGFYLLSWGLFDRSLVNLFLAIATGLIGSAAEGSLGIAGLYYYAHPDFFGVPLWLPVLYANASATAGSLGRYLLKSG
ncbi:MAG: hypothetical protein Q7T03_03280 [Deltaproteobacteria bacterium]|nr:hypothetical protein [Deltaproteobacteria bacterium]